MKLLSVISLAIPDIKVIRFARFRDQRGYFTETFRKSDLAKDERISSLKGIDFVQGNESYSRSGTIRGLHFQWNPFMGKLVRTVRGHMVDFVLDIRKGSPTQGHLIGYEMPDDAESEFNEWIWVPPGFAHGNCFPGPTQIEYLCSGEYSQGCEACISPFAVDIDWSLCEPALRTIFKQLSGPGAIITDKDRNGLSLHEWFADDRSKNFVYGQC
jgi:dTDP-4-dehydrorhamnose 3,5-epimerase